MTTARHPRDELQDLLDGRLDIEHRADVEAHLAACAQCRLELEALRSVKRVVKEALAEDLNGAVSFAPKEAPAGLLERIAEALDEEDRSARADRQRTVRRVAYTFLAAAAAALLLLLWPRGAGDLTELAARDFAQYHTAALTLDLETSEPDQLEAFFVQGGIQFATRVFDLGMMGYQLAGGRVHQLDGRLSALFAYRGPQDRRVICQMYEGSLSELPAPLEERENNGIRFRIYRREGLTLVFWQEGSVVCVLVSDGDLEELVQLAYAKAMRV